MAITTAGLNLAANGFTDGALWGSLHTSAPGIDGDDEVTGGGYGRVQVDWHVASGGISGAEPVPFDGPVSTSAPWFGLWTDETGGTFLGAEQLTGDTSFNAAGELTVSPTITARNPT